MKELTSKEINVGLSKKGWGVEDFMSNYGYSNLDELKEALGKVFSNSRNVNQVIKSMKQNSKRRNKQNASNNSALPNENEKLMYTSVAEQQMAATAPYDVLNIPNAINTAEENLKSYAKSMSEQAELVEGVETIKTAETTVAAIPIDTVKNTVLNTVAFNLVNSKTAETVEDAKPDAEPDNKEDNQLELLNDRLSQLDDEIMSSESTCKSLISFRRSSSKKVDEITEKLEQLNAEVSKYNQMFQVVYSEYSQNEARYTEAKAHLNELQQERENVMSQICELTVISIYCGDADGTGFDYRLSEQDVNNDKVNEKFKSFFDGDLSDSGLIDDFSVSELKLVAKIIITCERIEEEESKSVELCFDQKNKNTDLLEFLGKKVKIVS